MKHFLAAALVLATAQMTQAGFITISPGSEVLTGPETKVKDILSAIESYAGTKNVLYKQDVGGGESGILAGSYTTVFSNSPGDPADADITYDGGNIASGNSWLLVKNGNHSPAWYLFDLDALGWDGVLDLQLRSFWPAKGAISHVAIIGDTFGPQTGVAVPEPTSMALWALGGMALVGFRRRR